MDATVGEILDGRVANELHLPEIRVSYQLVGGWNSATGKERSDHRVCLPLQRTDRPPSETGRRHGRHHQTEQHLCRMRLPGTVRLLRQDARGPAARHGWRDAGTAGRRLIAPARLPVPGSGTKVRANRERGHHAARPQGD